MTLVLLAAVMAFRLFAFPPALPQGLASGVQTQNADSQSVQNHVITVSRSGEAYAKPDVGILIMSIHSTSPIANEAVAQNGDKAKATEAALTSLGFSPASFQITSVTFGQAGGPRIPGQQTEITAYEANQSVFVFFAAADLSDVGKLTDKAATVIEALRKAGAVPGNMAPRLGDPFVPAAQGALIIYAVKDPAQYEDEALKVAVGRARDAAQNIAAASGVKITGMRSMQSSYLGGNVMPRSGSSPLEGLRYRWFTTKSDELPIIANATVEYNFE